MSKPFLSLYKDFSKDFLFLRNLDLNTLNQKFKNSTSLKKAQQNYKNLFPNLSLCKDKALENQCLERQLPAPSPYDKLKYQLLTPKDKAVGKVLLFNV